MWFSLWLIPCVPIPGDTALEGEECMSPKKFITCALTLAALGLNQARGQEPHSLPVAFDSTLPAEARGDDPAKPTAETITLGKVSDWISYNRPQCCGSIGGNGPIAMELFARTGFSIPAEGRIFGHVLETGWAVEGGGRSLFFNQAMDRAWAIDLSISNVFNYGQHWDISVPFTHGFTSQFGAFTTQTSQVTIRQLNRTNVNLGGGYEWYLWAPANASDCSHCRFGMDTGGRVGSVKIEFNEIRHSTDLLGGVYVGLHADWEKPCGACTFIAGFRAEWSYNWMDVLQTPNDSDLMDVNLLFTAGIRF